MGVTEKASDHGAGGLIRNHQGRWLAGFTASRANGSVIMAEATTLLLGLQMAWIKGYREVLCEVDNKDLIKFLGDQTVYSLMPILKDIKDLFDQDWSCTIFHVSRDANTPADWLAKYGANNPSIGTRDFVDPPFEVEALMLRDFLIVP